MKVVEQPKTYLEIGETTRFTISFAPKTTMEYVGMVSISNNDRDFSPYTFTIKGVGYASVIHVKQGDDYIPSVNGSYDFGEIRVGEASPAVTFTIENVGTEALTLTDSPMIQISSADSSMFNIDQTSTISPIAPEESTTFTISFSPASIGDKSAIISIGNNDPNYNPHTFTVFGVGVSPEINVKQGSTDIPSGTGVFDFGEILFGNSSSDIDFTIENIGTSDLNLTGSPKIEIAGTDSAMFTVTQSMTISPITPASQTTFKIQFNPTNIGNKTASISIANDDLDEDPYTFTLEAKCIGPEINVKQGTEDIVSGSGNYYIDFVILGNSSPDITFTIENLGNIDLNLNGSPRIELSGTDSSMFSLNQSMTASTIAPGNTSTFIITFNPTSLGTKSATISIVNNDNDENPYTFTVTGYCVHGQTEFDFNGDGVDDIIVGASYDDDNGENSGCAFIFFGNPHTTKSIDASNADVKLVGKSRSIFGSSVCSAGDFNGDGMDDVIVGACAENDVTGAAYIFFGRKNPPKTINASNADIEFIGEDTGDYFGISVSYAGDCNGDGLDDVIVGGWMNGEGGTDAGSAYIFMGSTNPQSIIYASNADVKFVGEDAYDHFSYSVSNAGDVNGDGIDDVIVGAECDSDNGTSSGCAFILYGQYSFPRKIDASAADMKIKGEDAFDCFGRSVSSAGDFNGDGFGDFIVGANYDDNNGDGSGCAYIYYGSASLPAVIDASNANIMINGNNLNDQLGMRVSFAGDVNGDGFDDVIFGAPQDESSKPGYACVLFGRAGSVGTINASNANIILIGESTGDCFGVDVCTAGDLNGDGFSDFIVGAWRDDDNGTDTGCAFMFYGKANLSSSINAPNADMKLIGSSNDDRFGYSLAGGK